MLAHAKPKRPRKPSERIDLTEAPIDDIHQMADGERRANGLIQLLSKQVQLWAAHFSLRKVDRSTEETFLKAMTVWQNSTLSYRTL